MKAAFCLCLLCLCTSALAQALKFEPYPGSKYLHLAYDRFRDQSILATKPEPVDIRTGQGSFLDPGRGRRFGSIAAAVLFSGKDVPKQPSVILIISPHLPGVPSKLGSNQLYFPPDADLIYLVDSQRLAIGRGEKPGGFTSSGDYNDSVFFTLTHKQLGQLSGAKKLEAAIGQSEIKIESSPLKILAMNQVIS